MIPINLASYARYMGVHCVYHPSQVTTHHEELLTQAAGVNNLESSLGSVKRGLMELDSSLDKWFLISVDCLCA
jgi:hypothetical protein